MKFEMGLFTKDTNAVDLNGWRISKGVQFAFSNVTLAAGHHLVVVADVTAFQSRYPSVTNVVGGWVGLLSNNGEQIQFDNALGQQEDEVSYANEGDWAVRRRGPVLPPRPRAARAAGNSSRSMMASTSRSS